MSQPEIKAWPDQDEQVPNTYYLTVNGEELGAVDVEIFDNTCVVMWVEREEELISRGLLELCNGALASAVMERSQGVVSFVPMEIGNPDVGAMAA